MVVLSPAFFAKGWPQYELDGLCDDGQSPGSRSSSPCGPSRSTNMSSAPFTMTSVTDGNDPSRTALAADHRSDLTKVSDRAVGSLKTWTITASATVAAPTFMSCPDCAEDVRLAARKCRFCGYMFQDVSAEA